MKLLIVRHAVALEREEWAKLSSDDRDRPLTEGGAKKMKKIARALRLLIGEEPEALISSPLMRAQQTADLLSNEMPHAQRLETETLAPEQDRDTFIAYLRNQFSSTTKIVACVGHEPHLNELISLFVCKSKAGIGELKKGGACLIEFENGVGAGKGRLRWLMTSKMLREFASREARK